MPQRMGCTLVDKRNWPVYNEQLVRRSEALLGMNVLEGWEDELEQMNRRKRGRPYSFPASLFRFLAFLRQAQRLPLRQMEGLLRSRSLDDLAQVPGAAVAAAQAPPAPGRGTRWRSIRPG